MPTIRILGAILVLAVILLTGCSYASNENANTANTNTNANANRAAVNANTPQSTAAANTNANDNRRTPTREEYERNKETYAQEAKRAGRKIGTGVSDGWLWVKARYELAAADD